MRKKRETSILGTVFHGLFVVTGAVALTAVFFLVLPLIQAIQKEPKPDTELRTFDTGSIEPPPPPPEDEPEEEDEQEEEPPELEDEVEPLNLDQLELSLNSGIGEGLLGGMDSLLTIAKRGPKKDDASALFSLGDLDQNPRVTYKENPQRTKELRSRGGTVTLIFIVNEQGRVEKPIVKRSTHPAFDSPALAAIRKWKFEPGKKAGKAVRSRMKLDITFPKDYEP